MRHATLRETLVIRKRRKKERERERTEGGKEEGGEEERERGWREGKGGREGGRGRGGRGGREKETYCNTSYTIVFANSLLQYEYDHRLISRNTHL